MSGLSTLLDKAESVSSDDVDGANKLLVLRLVTFLDGVGGSTTRVTLNLEPVKNVGELPVEWLPADNGDKPLPVLLTLHASLTFDTWNRLRDGLANGLKAGDGNGDLSRLSQFKRFIFDFLTLTVGGGANGNGSVGNDPTLVVVVMFDVGVEIDGGGDDSEFDIEHDDIGDSSSSNDGDDVMLIRFGDNGDLIVVVLSKFDNASMLFVGDVRIMFWHVRDILRELR